MSLAALNFLRNLMINCSAERNPCQYSFGKKYFFDISSRIAPAATTWVNDLLSLRSAIGRTGFHGRGRWGSKLHIAIVSQVKRMLTDAAAGPAQAVCRNPAMSRCQLFMIAVSPSPSSDKFCWGPYCKHVGIGGGAGRRLGAAWCSKW